MILPDREHDTWSPSPGAVVFKIPGSGLSQKIAVRLATTKLTGRTENSCEVKRISFFRVIVDAVVMDS